MTARTSRGHCRAIRAFKSVLVIATALSVGAFSGDAGALDLLLGTGAPGSFSHFAGKTICRVINSHTDDLTCNPASAPDDMYRLTNLQGGSLDMALIDSRMLVDAIQKSGRFEFLDFGYDNLRVLATVYDVPITLVVRGNAGIGSVDDLKGKRINAGTPRTPQHIAVDTIMQAKNWQAGDFSLVAEISTSQGQDHMAFCHGAVQAMIHIGVHPDPSLVQLLRLCQAELVDISDADIDGFVAQHPAFSKTRIAPGIYPSHPNGTATFGTQMMLVTSEDLDDQTASQILQSIYGSRGRLKRSHAALSLSPVGDAAEKRMGIKRHPAAARYTPGD